MGTKFKILSTIVMFLLILLLIGILVNYYNEPIEIKEEVIVSTNPPEKIEPVIKDNKSSGDDKEIIASNSGDEMTSGEFGNNKDNNTIISLPQEDNQVIISSETTMTNKEKKEILTELDNTLMDLLEVVDSVKTVDETRLITDEGEVQK